MATISVSEGRREIFILPIIFAKEENVIPLKISYRELYSITASLGRNTPGVLEEEIPEILEELKTESTE
ncbi:hypothetical protein ACFLU4_00935 [Chloroflexota bacterium]